MEHRILWSSIVCLGLCSPWVRAQQPPQFQKRAGGSGTAAAMQSGSAISADLRSVYDQTQAATTEASITEIARACSKIIPDAQRSRADRDYASNLFSWALNRRGELRNERAAALVVQGQAEEAGAVDRQAAKDFETAIQHNPKNWRIRHNFGISLAMSGDYLRAIEEFSAAIELKPDYANSHFNRGELYFELSQYVTANTDYTAAIDLDATDPQYFNSRGHSRFMLKAYDEALADYSRATQLGSDSAVYHTDLADAHQFLGQWEEAAQGYRAAVAVNSKFPRAYQNAAWLMATCPNEKIRNAELALSAAKKAIELTGEKSPQALDTLAAASAAVGKHSEAASLQRQAVQLAENDEKAEMSQRLRLYEQGQSYLQQQPASAIAGRAGSQSTRIRTASGNSGDAR